MSNSAPNSGDPARRGPRHARRRPSKRPLVAALLGLSGFFALFVYSTIGGGGVAQAAAPQVPVPSGSTAPSGTKTVSVKASSITDAGCAEGTTGDHTGVYLVITQIDQADAPTSVQVVYAPSGTGDAPRVKNNLHESAYEVTFPAGVTGITDATAVVPADWDGQFVVSHYLCGSSSTTPSTPETTPVTTTPSTPETTPVTTTPSTPETTPVTTTPSTPETTPVTTTPSTPETTPVTSSTPASSSSAFSSSASEATASSSSAFVPGPGQTNDSRPSGGSPLKTIMLGLALALLGTALAVLVQPYLRRRGNHA